MFAPSTSNQKESTSLARKEAKTLTSTSNHATMTVWIEVPQLKIMGIHWWKLHRQGRKLYRHRGILLSNQSWMLCGLRRRGNDKHHQ
jgi:hypothetical protein